MIQGIYINYLCVSNNILHVRSKKSFIASIRECVLLRLKLIKSLEIAFLKLINKHSALLIKTNYS